MALMTTRSIIALAIIALLFLALLWTWIFVQVTNHAAYADQPEQVNLSKQNK
jgi:hypothetical protein